ncbi:MAG: OsmC family peroxiredoxin [Thermomicrobiales bacterium]
MVERTAVAAWQGTLFEGKGTVSTGTTGVLKDQPVTWAARTAEPEGMTSPEELIAAAHAACYAMALSNVLAQNETPAETLEISATVGFGPKTGGGMEVKHSRLKVVGTVPGLNAQQFSELASKGESGCPVSNALRNNVEITVEAELA